jgi:hypothetical protein
MGVRPSAEILEAVEKKAGGFDSIAPLIFAGRLIVSGKTYGAKWFNARVIIADRNRAVINALKKANKTISTYNEAMDCYDAQYEALIDVHYTDIKAAINAVYGDRDKYGDITPFMDYCKKCLVYGGEIYADEYEAIRSFFEDNNNDNNKGTDEGALENKKEEQKMENNNSVKENKKQEEKIMDKKINGNSNGNTVNDKIKKEESKMTNNNVLSNSAFSAQMEKEIAEFEKAQAYQLAVFMESRKREYRAQRLEKWWEWAIEALDRTYLDSSKSAE